jgi:hypothetical protein
LNQFSKNQTDSQDLNQVQDALVKCLNPLFKNPILDGSVITASLKTGPNQVPHLLGRNIIGWILCGQNAGAAIYDNQSTNTLPSLFLNLVSSAPVTVKIYVF